MPVIRRILRQAGVELVEADQCMYGLKTWGSSRSQLVLAKKPTKFMTNSRSIGRELSRKCDGRHEHQPLIDGRAKDAARYPPALCRAICRGMSKEKMLRASEEALLCDLVIVLGSSLVVYPASAIPMEAKRNGARMAIINREPTDQDPFADLVLHTEIGSLMTDTMALLDR